MNDEIKRLLSCYSSLQHCVTHHLFMLITLLTDFGTADYFVGAMKGVILSINPEAQIVDITHEIPPQDIQAGAFTLLAAYQTFPRGTLHVAVVDPGVGSSRGAHSGRPPEGISSSGRTTDSSATSTSASVMCASFI